MYQFFVEPEQIIDKKIVIIGSDVNHIKNVLRMRIGEAIRVVTASEDRYYQCEIENFEDDRIVCQLLFIKEEAVELPNRICLLQGLPKGDKMEMIIQKAVELGASEIVPIQTKRAVVKLDAKKEKSKLLRWNAISEAAAKQSQRRIVPEVKKVMTMKEAADYCKDFEIKLIPYEQADMNGMKETRKLLSEILPEQRIAVFIGPEGGFDDMEIQLAEEAGITPITLGHRILRTETAGMTVLAWLVYQLEQ